MPRAFKEYYVNSSVVPESQRIYLEIGVRWGESLRAVRAHRKIGIDPVRHPAVTQLRPGEEFYEMTSDDFFAQYAPEVLSPGSIHVALVDGLHEFHHALRDVLNLVPYMAPNGFIVLDDCNPATEELAVDTPTGGGWNGDVWKVMTLLRCEVPQLRAVTVRRDQGVGLVWGFDRLPAPVRVETTTAMRYKVLPFAHLGADRANVLGLVGPSRTNLRSLGVPLKGRSPTHLSHRYTPTP